MARRKAKAPKRRYHSSGQSVVTLNSRDFYLGPHDSPESIARYAMLISVDPNKASPDYMLENLLTQGVIDEITHDRLREAACQLADRPEASTV